MLAYIRKVNTVKSASREEGASAVEYGLLVAAIAAIIIALVFAIGAFVQNSFERTCDGLAADQNTTADADC